MSLEKKLLGIEYVFESPHLLKAALTHPSVTRVINEDYERLEFLGDRVLGLVIAKYLYTHFPNDREGILSKKMAALVSRKSLASVAKDIQLGNHLRMTPGEKKTGGAYKESNLANSMEALLGALYLDGGFAIAESVILNRWASLLLSLAEYKGQDPKSTLQELAQKQGLGVEYHLLKKEGSQHDPLFTVGVKLSSEQALVEAQGRSKRQAEREAASKLLQQLVEKIS